MLKHGSPWSIPFWVIIVNPFFIANDYTVQKTLSFIPGKQHFTCGKLTFNVSRRHFIWNPISLYLYHSQSHIMQPHYMLLQAIDASQLQMSQNWRSKSKVLANDAYAAQKSTFSNIKEDIIMMKMFACFLRSLFLYPAPQLYARWKVLWLSDTTYRFKIQLLN